MFATRADAARMAAMINAAQARAPALRRAAAERRALKRWLRARGIRYSTFQQYNRRALVKLVRDHQGS